MDIKTDVCVILAFQNKYKQNLGSYWPDTYTELAIQQKTPLKEI